MRYKKFLLKADSTRHGQSYV
eukprot:UN11201